ncbi:MAG: hypothetical protein K6G88_13025 [Lachnospiraceae bacterium]|nr:hypothetical protein [Lachnospiraceae bacterium]
MQKEEMKQVFRICKYMLETLKSEWSKSKESYMTIVIEDNDRAAIAEYINGFMFDCKENEINDPTGIIEDLRKTKKACVLLRLAKKLELSTNGESIRKRKYELVLDKDESALFMEIMNEENGGYYYELCD